MVEGERVAADKTVGTSDARRLLAGALMNSTNPGAQRLLADALLLAVSPKTTTEKTKKPVKKKKK